MKYLQDMAGVMNKLDLPIKWTTPAGFPVVQKYMEMKERQIRTQIGDKIIKPSISELTNNISKPKQKSAISPNYVHSLDAAALMKTVNGCLTQNINNFAMIHDSYGTHAADSVALAATLRRTFVDMFGGEGVNLLEQWKNEVLASVPEPMLAELPDLPILPATGDLDVGEVAHSLFFFA